MVPLVNLSPRLRRLLEHKLDSLEKLEVALELRTSGRAMSIEELALALQVGPDVMRRLAAELALTSLLSFDPALDVASLHGTDEEQRALEEAAALYERDRVDVLKIMSLIAMDRLRSLAARTFADAFQIRRKRDDDDR